MVDEMAGGAIPFERFMQLVLYHPDFGYYRQPGRIGKTGDFLTSPVIHPMFGWAVAAWCRRFGNGWDGPGSSPSSNLPPVMAASACHPRLGRWPRLE